MIPNKITGMSVHMKQRLLRAISLILCCITAALVFQGCSSESTDKKEKAQSSSIGSVQQSGPTEPIMGYHPVEIPDEVKNVIKQKYPQATLMEFEKAKNGTMEIDILDGSIPKVVVLSPSFKWVYTVWDIGYNNLPQAVKNAVKQACSDTDYIDDDADIYETPDGMRYRIDIERINKEYKLWFDESGEKVPAIIED